MYEVEKSFFVSLIFIAFVVLLVAPSSADEQARQMKLIKAVVIKDMCFSEYWADETLYRRDSPLTMRVLINGNKFYSKVEDVYFFHGHSTTLYQIGLLDSDKAVVTHNFELDMKRRLTEEAVITDTLTLPPDCTPRYDPTTPQKELMLRTVVKTVQDHLEGWVRKGIAQYPREVTLIISDFDMDYQRSYILVEQTGELYHVTLHNPQDYYSDLYEREGSYPFGMTYDPPKSLLDKIRNHGIRKKIILNIP